jgi:hypothetical protein
MNEVFTAQFTLSLGQVRPCRHLSIQNLFAGLNAGAYSLHLCLALAGRHVTRSDSGE